jgi:membrane dipeptidase
MQNLALVLAGLFGLISWWSAKPMHQERSQAAAAAKLHEQAILIDGHNDLPWVVREKAQGNFSKYDIGTRLSSGHTDIPRLRAGGVKAQFWSIYVPVEHADRGEACRVALEQIDLVYRMIERYSDHLELAMSADDIERVVKKGKIASLLGLEGGHCLENSLAVLRIFHRLGVRYMTLTHRRTHDWADSATDRPRHHGLSPFGEAVVREMNRLGMLVDISHVSHDTMRHVLRVSEAPVIASHSSAYAVAPHPRNVPDDVLQELFRKGGLVMVNFYSGFVSPEAARMLLSRCRSSPLPRATLQQVLDHIDHIVRVAGVEHVGLGSDFDGIDSTPVGLEDVSCFLRLTEGLLQRGYTAEQIRLILGGNLLRVMRRAEEVARQLQESGP